MHFEFDDLKTLAYRNHVQRMWLRELSIQKKLELLNLVDSKIAWLQNKAY